MKYHDILAVATILAATTMYAMDASATDVQGQGQHLGGDGNALSQGQTLVIGGGMAQTQSQAQAQTQGQGQGQSQSATGGAGGIGVGGSATTGNVSNSVDFDAKRNPVSSAIAPSVSSNVICPMVSQGSGGLQLIRFGISGTTGMSLNPICVAYNLGQYGVVEAMSCNASKEYRQANPKCAQLACASTSEAVCKSE